MDTDVLIVGSGCAGLYAALKLPRNLKITIITKRAVEDSDSFLAQGGMCVLKSEDDFDSYFEDTMRVGHYENDEAAVKQMISESPEVLKDLLSYGARFHRDAEGNIDYTREGGHSAKRIVYHEDQTGKEITSTLYERVKELDNVSILEYTKMLDLVIKDNKCYGAVVRKSDKSRSIFLAKVTILATGGIGGLYKFSTNFRNLTGDSLAISLKHGIELEHINYIQVHPTTFYVDHPRKRSFLISESVRGEGAKLYDKNMERFTDELQPRDVLTGKIREQMAKDGTEHVWEDMRPIPKDEVLSHFPNIVKHCKDQGYDPLTECIPVVPAQHYFMGGVKVDLDGHTSCTSLYAIGETACNGVHGKNRLASNSLLESLVWARKSAADIVEKFEKEESKAAGNDTESSSDADFMVLAEKAASEIDLSQYGDDVAISTEYRDLILAEIDRLNAESGQPGIGIPIRQI